jgi:YidC/Oxa1 family membrane protein insertase
MKLTTVTKKIKDEFTYTGNVDWFALKNKYFFLVMNNFGKIDNISFYKLPQEERDKKESEKTSMGNPLDEKVTTAAFGCYFMGGSRNRFGAEVYCRDSLKMSVMLLPIKYSILVEYKKDYEEITSGGILKPIVNIILFIFNLLYSFIKNYGFVIMLFAIVVKAIFFPLSRQMIMSQHKMQMVQPELKKLQKKYKDNPQKLNQEMMHLYKTYKVNPFSGCLPLLIQMPIFIALYQTLATSIEFRQAAFIFWITDLSFKDPYYVLPIAMGVMMLIQSLKTTIDPRQKFMVIIMPIFMVYIFLNFPSGLQLYWFTYNILTLIEHFITRRGGIK